MPLCGLCGGTSIHKQTADDLTVFSTFSDPYRRIVNCEYDVRVQGMCVIQSDW